MNTVNEQQLPASLVNAGVFEAEAIYLGQRIKWNSRMPWPILATAPLTILVNTNGCAVLFRHGVVVMFNLNAGQRKLFLDELKSLVSEPLPVTETESVTLRIAPGGREGADFETLLLHQVDIQRLQLVADILAKSTIMAFYETQVTAQFDRRRP